MLTIDGNKQFILKPNTDKPSDPKLTTEIPTDSFTTKRERIIVVGIIVVLFILVVAIVFRPSVYGVVGTSMEPTIYEGDTVIVVKGLYKEGDIIAFYWDDLKVIHRIKSVEDDGYIAQGDNNEIPDDLLITDCLIIGKMVVRF